MRAPGDAAVEEAIEEAAGTLRLLAPDIRSSKSRLSPTERVAWAQSLLCVLRAPAEHMPEHVRSHLLKLLKLEPHLPGRRTYANSRDVCIAEAVNDIVERGFPPTRNSTSRKGGAESACSIVQKALARLGVHLDERNVEAIWAKAKDIPGLFSPTKSRR